MFGDKPRPPAEPGLEWCIYHSVKWCLNLKRSADYSVSEEEPPAPLPSGEQQCEHPPPPPPLFFGLFQRRLSELVSCSNIHSVSTSSPCSTIHPPAAALPHPHPRVTSQCLSPPFFLQASTAPPLHPALGPDEPLWDSSRWMGNKEVTGGPPLPVPPCITANQAVGNLLQLSQQSNE